MRLLAINAYYEPEIAASIHLSTNLYEDIAKSGIKVDLYTPMPTRGISKDLRSQYKKTKKEIKHNGNLTIYRFAMYREGTRTLNRAFRYLLTNIVSLWKGIRNRSDVIFVQSTPPTQGAMAVLIKKIKRIPFIYNLQDVFPDSLVNTGLTQKGSFLWKVGRVIENYTYKNADKIIVISEDFKSNIMAKGVPEEKIEVIYNWVDENAVVPIDRNDNILFDKYNLDKGKFYITHCGNIGFTQNMDLLIDVAKQLEDYKEIQFILIGDGAYKTKVESLLLEKGVNNIKTLPYQPYEDISHVFSLGDVGLVISKANVGQNSVPSKTWSIMSAERPVLVSFDMGSELSSLITKADCGVCVPPDDKEALKNAILELYNARDLLSEKGENGRKYILENLTRAKGTAKYINVIKGVLEK